MAMKAHAGDILSQVTGGLKFKAGRCEWCGSMTFERALELLKTPGTKYSGSDWKYGWPHKFYVGDGKFYSEHLRDVPDAQLLEWNLVAQPLLGIVFVREEDQPDELFFGAPEAGFQTYGIVP